VERASRAQHLQHEQRKRVDRQRQGHHPQTIRRARATTTTATPYYFGGIPKIKDDACCLFSGPGLLNKRSQVFFLGGLLNVKDAHQMDSILDLELDVKLRQTLDDVTIENQFLILIIDSSY
jgi:hypothetical protein